MRVTRKESRMSEIMINGMVRRLTDKDLPSINDLLIEQRISPLHISRLPEEWLLYGAFEEDKLIALCGLFCSRRFPHRDYPSGYVAELGALYTSPAYRNRGIMTDLIREALKRIPEDRPGLDALTADSNEMSTRLLRRAGFKDAVSGETRLWLSYS